MQSERGFTLIEIVIALTVTGLAVAYLVQLFASNLRLIGISQDYTAALTRAESVMREIADSGQIEETSWKDERDPRYHVEVTVSETHGERTEQLPVKLLQIDAVFSWETAMRKRTMTLRTLKLVNRTDNRSTVEHK